MTDDYFIKARLLTIYEPLNKFIIGTRFIHDSTFS
jgi:hypothetical protein